MAPSWSVYLLPVCLGVMSVKQADWEHICTPHSSTEANPDTEEQAGLFSAPRLSAKFPALLETWAEPCFGRGEGRGQASPGTLCFQLLLAEVVIWLQERGARRNSTAHL